MYRNVFGERVSRARWREMVRAAKNRAELVAARVTRRDLLKSGLLTGGGYLVAKHGLSARLGSMVPTAQAASPPVEPFVEPLPIMPIKQPVSTLSGPPPTIAPNSAGGEGRTRPHQAFTSYPSTHFSKPSQIPRTYYTDLLRHTKKGDEIMFMEIGWPTAGRGDESSQMAFIQALPGLMEEVRPKILAWALLHDVTGVLTADLATTGLLTTDGRRKPAFDAFKQLR